VVLEVGDYAYLRVSPIRGLRRFNVRGKQSPRFIGVNTKNWYREETDMWAEFGRRTPFGRRFSAKHSVEASEVGSTSLFGRRTVPRVNAESIRECVMTWIEYKEGDELMTGTRRT
jgi:hypothetical protein